MSLRRPKCLSTHTYANFGYSGWYKIIKSSSFMMDLLNPPICSSDIIGLLLCFVHARLSFSPLSQLGLLMNLRKWCCRYASFFFLGLLQKVCYIQTEFPCLSLPFYVLQIFPDIESIDLAMIKDTRPGQKQRNRGFAFVKFTSHAVSSFHSLIYSSS